MAQVIAPVGAGSNNGEVQRLDDGGFMVVWTHLVSSLLPIADVTDDQFTAVLGRVFNADGTPRGDVFQVNTSTNASGQGEADIALLSNGNVVVSWTDGPDLDNGADVSAWARILGADGTPVTDAIELSTATQRDQSKAEVTAYGDGGFVAVWKDARDPWSNTASPWVAQVFDDAGARVGDELFIGGTTATQQGILLHNGGDVFTLVAETGAIFELGSTFAGYAGLPSPTANQLVSSQGNFEVDAVVWPDGQVATLIPESYGLRLRLEEPVARDAPSGTFYDGTPKTDYFDLFWTDSSIGQNTVMAWQDFSLGFTPALPSVAAAVMPNGNLAIVWTQTTGGTEFAPEATVFAQILSREGVVLSDPQIIADQNVINSENYPPFVAAGADNTLFIGWSGTTDRNGAGTVEIFGGVHDVPLKDFSASTAGDDTIHGSAGNDTYTGEAGTDLVYLFDGNDLIYQGLDGTPGGTYDNIYGMGGDDRFIAQGVSGDYPASQLPSFYGGVGYDTYDMSALAAPVLYFGNQGDAAQTTLAEQVIGTLFDDQLIAGRGEGLRLHAEAGDDTITYGNYDYGGEIDGGDGTDILTTYLTRADFDLTQQGDHYRMVFTGFSFNNDTLSDGSPRYVATLRSIEEIHFENGVDILSLNATASLASGGIGSAGGLPPEPPKNESGTSRNDTLTGTAGNDTLSGLAGDDRIEGRGGNDEAYGNQGADTLLGGGGDDRLDGGLDADSISGDNGNDTVIGGGGFDTLRGGGGDDTVNGGDGRDLAYLGGGNDLFIDNAQGGVNGRDTVYANAGNDTVGGGNGDDVFNGQDGNDRLLGRLGNDKLFGGNQNDTMVGGDGNDTIAGGNGRDRAFMGNGNDTWFDNAQVQFGDDSVVGGNGDDTIRSDAGNDTLSGGAGADLFIFAATLGDVTVTDFDTASDAIDMAAALWTGAFDQAALDAMSDTSSGSLVLTLDNGGSLTFANLTDNAGLLDDIVLV